MKLKRKSNHCSFIDYEQLEARQLLAQFSGTIGQDFFVIDFVEGRPATIDINGVVHTNPDETLRLDLNDGFGFGVPDEITITGRGGHNVSFGFPTTIDNSVTIDMGQEGLRLTIEEGDNMITDLGDFSSTGGGVQGIPGFLVTGAGNDKLILNGGAVSAILGDGDDQITAMSFTGRGKIDGGEGFDSVKFDRNLSTSVWQLGFSGEGRLDLAGNDFVKAAGAAFLNFEQYIAPELAEEGPKDQELLLTSNHATLVVGNNTYLVPTDNSEVTEHFVNFNQFVGHTRGVSLFVAETNYPISTQGVSVVNLGGDFSNGDTSKVQHEVSITNANSIVISNSAAIDSQSIDLSLDEDKDELGRNRYRLSGLTSQPIILADVDHTNLASSSMGSDQFIVSAFDGHLVLFGNGGDDNFFIGSQSNGGARNLSECWKSCQHRGRAKATDFIRRRRSRIHKPNEGYRLNETWVHTTGNSPDQSFLGMSHAGAERVELIANELANQFLLTPSNETQYTITGGKTDGTPEEKFFLIPPHPSDPFFVELATDEFVWWFGDDEDDPEFIHIRNYQLVD